MILRGDHCLCVTCGEHFNSTAAFDKHRTGRHGKDRRCLTEPEILQRNMERNASGWWIGSKRPPEARPSLSSNSRGGDLA